MKMNELSKVIKITKGKKKGKKSTFALINDFINNIAFSELVLLFTGSKMFDMQKNIKSRDYEIESMSFFNEKQFIVSVSRTENTINHHRVFDTLQLYKVHNTTKKTILGIKTGMALEIDNMHEFKEIAGLDDYTDKQVIDMIEDIAQIHINIKKIDKDKKQTEFLSFHLLGNVDGRIKIATQECISLTIWLDSLFLDILTRLTKTKIDVDTLKYIHKNAKNAVVEKIIKFFLPLHSELFFKDDDFLKLIRQISDIPIFNKKTKENVYNKFDNESGQYRNEILANIDTESELLKEFGIEFNKKQLSISYNPTKSKFYKSNILPIDYLNLNRENF